MSKVKNISAVILSAGYSSRMGDFKPLMKIGKSTVLERCVDLFKMCGIDDVIVVLGHNCERVIPYLENKKIKYVINKFYDKGMFSSVVNGIKSIQANSRYFFILPVDIPAVKSETIIREINAVKQGIKIIYPVFNEKRGHPPLISTEVIDEIINYSGEGGLRKILEKYDNCSLGVPVIDHGVIMDMDTKFQYENIKKYLEKSYIPDIEECRCMLKSNDVSQEIVNHCKKVSEIAEKISVILNEKGENIDVSLIKVAALLHDIERKKHNHALEGSILLRKYGYDKVAEIIEEHMDIEIKGSAIEEKEIVYFADKVVKGNKVIHIGERFSSSINRFKNKPEVTKNIRKRFENANLIKNKIEKIFGTDIYNLLDEERECNE